MTRLPGSWIHVVAGGLAAGAAAMIKCFYLPRGGMDPTHVVPIASTTAVACVELVVRVVSHVRLTRRQLTRQGRRLLDRVKEEELVALPAMVKLREALDLNGHFPPERLAELLKDASENLLESRSRKAGEIRPGPALNAFDGPIAEMGVDPGRRGRSGNRLDVAGLAMSIRLTNGGFQTDLDLLDVSEDKRGYGVLARTVGISEREYLASIDGQRFKVRVMYLKPETGGRVRLGLRVVDGEATPVFPSTTTQLRG